MRFTRSLSCPYLALLVLFFWQVRRPAQEAQASAGHRVRLLLTPPSFLRSNEPTLR